jgi:hypothetical protein
MGYWECIGAWADEPMRHWIFGEDGHLQEVSSGTCVEDDGSLTLVPT